MPSVRQILLQPIYLIFLFHANLAANAPFEVPQSIKPVDLPLYHEAYMAPITGLIVLKAITAEPPPPMKEDVLPQLDPRLQWIPGYWAWWAPDKDFIWVTGTWRLPPPGMQWIPGSWKRFHEGWVWISGFWSSTSKDQLTYIPLPPPQLLEDQAPAQPGADYFWNRGHWSFDADAQQYNWVTGSWEQMDPYFYLASAHYVWQPEGYVFIPAFWEWPVENRGLVYAPVSIDRSVRSTAQVKPLLIKQSEEILRQMSLNYPDFLHIYFHHYYHHPDFWGSPAPPWWSWGSWWTLSWFQQWSLWWWYIHPGYPQPEWMSEKISEKIVPPIRELLILARKAQEPYFITPHGAIRPEFVVTALTDGKPLGKMVPILPADIKQLEEILDKEVKLSPRPSNILYPTAKRTNKPIEMPQIPVIKTAKTIQSGFKILQPAPLPKKPFIVMQLQPGSPLSPNPMNSQVPSQ